LLHFASLVRTYIFCQQLEQVSLLFRRGALIIQRLCVLLGAERVYRELSTILERETDLDFASIMVQVRKSV